MDGGLLGTLIAIVKSLPDTAVSKSEAAADRAETAAQTAIEHGYQITIDGETLNIEEGGES